jgi:hypothetical protein
MLRSRPFRFRRLRPGFLPEDPRNTVEGRPESLAEMTSVEPGTTGLQRHPPGRAKSHLTLPQTL